jgi:Mn-dependent DtxR family transcriptional regulator
VTRWFRFYGEAIADPKILKLPDALRWHWVAMLCVASKHDGTLPPLDDIAIELRVSNAKATEILAALVKAGLIDRTETGFAPHNWDGRQYKSDTSNERVKRHRESKRNATRNVTVTPPEQSRAETEQSRAEARPAFENDFFKSLSEVFGKPESELDRAKVWLGKGYSSTMILETVSEVLGRGTDIASLSYFDAILAERYASRPETPSERAQLKIDMDEVAAFFKKTGKWSKYAGPEPGMTGCRCPPDILAKHGIIVPGMRRMNA